MLFIEAVLQSKKMLLRQCHT